MARNNRNKNKEEEIKDQNNTNTSSNANASRKQGGTRNGGNKKPESAPASQRHQDSNYGGFTGNAVSNKILEQVSQVSFNNQVGTAMGYDNYPEPSVGVYSQQSPPGVMALYTLMTPGLLENQSSGANLAAQIIYQNMRMHLTTTKKYQPADILMYVVAASHIQAYLAFLSRIFRITMAYTFKNFNYPHSLLRACGFSDAAIVDLRDHLNDYRSRVNLAMVEAATIYLPREFAMTEQATFEYSNVFLDSDDAKAQIMMFVPYGYYLWDDTSSSEGTQLTLIDLGLDGASLTDDTLMDTLIGHWETMIRSFRNSDSFKDIAADMSKAYGESSGYVYALIMENEMINPYKDDKVLSQMENATILPRPKVTQSTFYTWNITQDVLKNQAIFRPAYPYSSNLNWYETNADMRWASGSLINAHWNDPTPEDVVNMTMYCATCTGGLTSSQSIEVESARFSMVLNCRIFTTYNGVTDNGFAISRFSGVSSVTPEWLFRWMAFDWAPTVYMGIRSTDESTPNNFQADSIHALCEYDNYVVVDSATLRRINRNYTTLAWNPPTF